jgi:methionyl-tRNA formyltransferase
MKIVFFGSGSFAVPVLQALHASRHKLLAVVTQPDRKKGRHLHLAATPVKECAQSLAVPILQPEDIREKAFEATLRAFGADVFAVVSFGCILPEEVLSAAGKMCVNVHASLLPKYRGAAPIRRALMAGDKVTGITFIRMNKGMDKGDILYKKKIRIDSGDNALTLDEKLARMSGLSIATVLALIERGAIRPVKQDERKATYAAKLTKEEGRILWTRSSRDIFNQFRGCFGWPGTFTVFRDKRLNITKLSTGKSRRRGAPGQVLGFESGRLEVACGHGTILIEEVTPESLPKMSAADFRTLFHVQEGGFLGTAAKNT